MKLKQIAISVAVAIVSIFTLVILSNYVVYKLDMFNSNQCYVSPFKGSSESANEMSENDLNDSSNNGDIIEELCNSESAFRDLVYYSMIFIGSCLGVVTYVVLGRRIGKSEG